MVVSVSRVHYAEYNFCLRLSNGFESMGANIYGVEYVSWKARTLYRGSLRRSMNEDIRQSTKQTLARKGKAKQAPALGYTEWQSRHAADESEKISMIQRISSPNSPPHLLPQHPSATSNKRPCLVKSPSQPPSSAYSTPPHSAHGSPSCNPPTRHTCDPPTCDVSRRNAPGRNCSRRRCAARPLCRR